jgi:hypothetical protein
VKAILAGVAALVALVAAVLVIVFGVLATSGVYGSRLAWLLGVALPLLALTMLLAWLSLGGPRRIRPETHLAPVDRRYRVGRGVLLVASSLLGIPLALAATLLAVYASLFAAHGLSLLL